MRLSLKIKIICLIVLANISAHALAQSGHLFMPPGSKDLYVGVVGADYSCAAGGTQRCGAVLPAFWGQWSNGIFASLDTVGLQISDEPTMDFGPIISYEVQQRRADDLSDKSSLALEGGAYYSFMLAYNIDLNARVLYGGGDNHQGTQINLGSDLTLRMAAHHFFTISPGLTWADNAYLQSTYGVTPQQSSVDGLPVYRTSAGIKNIYTTGNWYWEINNKFVLNTGLTLSRLTGSAAASPLVEQRNEVTLYSALIYHF